MKNVTDLRTELMKTFEELRSGAIDIKTADALANNAGKLIKGAALELEYNRTTKRADKTIPFLES